MAYNAVNVSIPLKFEIKAPPRGMIDYDPKALSEDQQKEINIYKLSLRKQNIMYLAAHPEIRGITSFIMRMVMVHKPRSIIEFVAKLFTRPEHDIRKEVHKILNESRIEYEPIPAEEYEEFEY